MDGELIKSFLVGLGFGVDTQSLSKFNKAVASATLKVTALYATIKTTAAAIAYGITKISEGFEQMGYEYHIIAPAINKALLLRRELLKAYTAAGINIQKVVRNSLALNLSLTKTRFALEAIYKSVASRFFELFTKQSDAFRQKLYANMPKIQAALERFIKFIFKAFEATNTLGQRLWSILGRVYSFFKNLDEVTNGWSTKILALVAIWEAFNLSFLATPLGAILALGAAILALYDDFKTFQEGGESFFNWTQFIPVIDAVAGALKSLYGVLDSIAQVIASIILSVYQLFQGDTRGAFDSLKESGMAFLSVLKNIWETIKGIGSSITAVGSFGSSLFGGVGAPAAAANVKNITANGGAPAVAPAGSSVSHAQTNQNVTQQTNINISGSPDATSTARLTATEQSRVNFDMVRNLRGAVRPGGSVR